MEQQYCDDCKFIIWDNFLLKDEVWNKITSGKTKISLCINCAQARSFSIRKKKLQYSDFKDHSINQLFFLGFDLGMNVKINKHSG